MHVPGERPSQGISRATFGRLVEAARHKVANALVNGKMIVIKGGVVAMSDGRTFVCRDCDHRFEAPHGAGRPARCPSSSSTNFGRAAEEHSQRGGRHRPLRQPLPGVHAAFRFDEDDDIDLDDIKKLQENSAGP